jgi:hypothetical protein
MKTIIHKNTIKTSCSLPYRHAATQPQLGAAFKAVREQHGQ